MDEQKLLEHLAAWVARWGYWPFSHVTVRGEPEHDGMVRARTIDLYAVTRLVADQPTLRGPMGQFVAIEAKTTRKDFAAEVRNPEKSAPWRKAGAYYYATPAALVHPWEVERDSGLLWVHDDGRITVEKDPPAFTDPMPTAAAMALVERAMKHERVIRGWEKSGDDVVDLQARLADAEAALARTRDQAARHKEAAEAWQMLAARQGHKVPCSSCGAPIAPTRISAGVPGGWRHAQPHLTTDCPGNARGIRPREDTP
jgi:RNA polymerase-binding transcription factor DksA